MNAGVLADDLTSTGKFSVSRSDGFAKIRCEKCV